MLDVDRFVISKELFAKAVMHAKKSAPYESVSIIAGEVRERTAFATQVFTPENIDKSTVTFTVDPLVLLKIYEEIERQGQIIVGIFHTHPAPPYPSPTDKDYMEVNPYVWLISSTSSPSEPKGFLLIEGESLKEIEVVIVD